MAYRTMYTSFAGGEIAPSMYGRVDLEKYAVSCKTVKNCIVHAHGGVSTDPGTEFIALAKYPDKKCRMVAFEYSDEQAYTLEFGDGYIRFFMNGGQVIRTSAGEWQTETPCIIGDTVDFEGVIYYCVYNHLSGIFADDLAAGYWITPAPYEISTYFSEDDIDKLKFTQSADVLFIACPNLPPTTLTRYSHTDWLLSEFDYKSGPFMKSNTDESLKISASGMQDDITLTATGDIFSADQVGSLMKITHEMDGQTISGAFASVGTGMMVSGKFVSPGYSVALNGTNSWYLWTKTYYCGFTMHVQLSTDKGATWTTTRTITVDGSSQSSVVGTYTGTFVGDALMRLNFVGMTDARRSDSNVKYSLTTSNQVIKCKGTWRLLTHGTWNATFNIERSFDKGETWRIIRSYSSVNDNNINTTGIEDEMCLIRLNCTKWTSGTLSYDLAVDSYSRDGVVKIKEYTSPTQVTATVLSELGKTEETDNWAYGAWSDKNGWPSTVGFYQDRLCFGATKAEQQKIWMSCTGDYNNFEINSPTEDTDSVDIPLPSRSVNRITNMISLSELIALTTSSDWKVGPASSDGVMRPGGIKAVCQQYIGSNDAEAAVIGNRAIYVQSQGSNIRDIGYSFESDGYLGDDLSIFANHLVKDNKIIGMAYQQVPDSIVWMVRDDGVLLGLTYVRAQQVLAWHKHTTEGKYESICVIPGNGYDEVWLATQRGNKRYIERMVKRLPTKETKDQFCVHCGLAREFETPVNIVTGLNHLEGMGVAVLADGNVLANADNPITVVNGQITLGDYYSKVVVGLPYVPELEPLPIEMQTQGGTIQGKLAHVASVILRLENSRGGWIGPDSNQCSNISYREANTTEEATPLYTGDLEHTLYGDHKEGASFYFKQVDPLPVTILAAIMKVSIGG